MNNEDRIFFSELVNKIDTHLQKTCDELQDLKLEFTKLKKDVSHYLESTKNNKTNNRELRYLAVGMLGGTSALFTALYTVFHI